LEAFGLWKKESEQDYQEALSHVEPHEDCGVYIDHEGREDGSETPEGVGESEGKATDLRRVELGRKAVDEDEGQRDAEFDAENEEVLHAFIVYKDIG